MSGPSSDPPNQRPREVVHCAKCDAENLAGATRCHECGGHLYLGCPACGAGNPRSLKTCTQCGARLGRSWFSRTKAKVFRRLNVVEAIAAFVVIGGMIWLALWLMHTAGGSGPKRESPEPAQEQHPAKEQPKPDEDPESK